MNYLRDPFPSIMSLRMPAADTLSDLLLLDHIAHYSWQVEDRCLSNGERAWAGGKLVGATAILAAGGPIMKGAWTSPGRWRWTAQRRWRCRG